MRFPHSYRQIATHVFTLFLGAIVTLGSLQALPSQAATVTAPTQIAQAIDREPTPAAIPTRSFVTDAVDRVGMAVVRIDTERTVTRDLEPFLDDPFFRRFFGDDAPQFPREQLQRGQGSGFIIDDRGVIITNAHVVDRADRVTVTLKDGRTFEGEVRGTDRVTDLAVVKIEGDRLPVAPLGDSARVRVGDWAIAVGNPLGLDNTVTLGIVSTLGRSSVQVGVPDKRLDFIQTDAAINPGNSGGPLLNARGQVIGINTAIRPDAMGIGFAIPIDTAKPIADQLAKGEAVAHPFVGIEMRSITPEDAVRLNSDPNSLFQVPEINGVLVVRVLTNTPAAEAGIRRGDVIFEIDGESVTSAQQLQRLVERSGVGKVLEFKLQRGDRTEQISVRTGEMRQAQ
ncbi:MAG: HhoA/HhoB/HtrA family serine endopeptidase [Cyanobacteriota bacterium]|nr:HhoA/HhoB/HtrA family serine endopeptidase [Cyanobacteriota bacterium]